MRALQKKFNVCNAQRGVNKLVKILNLYTRSCIYQKPTYLN